MTTHIYREVSSGQIIESDEPRPDLDALARWEHTTREGDDAEAPLKFPKQADEPTVLDGSGTLIGVGEPILKPVTAEDQLPPSLDPNEPVPDAPDFISSKTIAENAEKESIPDEGGDARHDGTFTVEQDAVFAPSDEPFHEDAQEGAAPINEPILHSVNPTLAEANVSSPADDPISGNTEGANAIEPGSADETAKEATDKQVTESVADSANVKDADENEQEQASPADVLAKDAELKDAAAHAHGGEQSGSYIEPGQSTVEDRIEARKDITENNEVQERTADKADAEGIPVSVPEVPADRQTAPNADEASTAGKLARPTSSDNKPVWEAYVAQEGLKPKGDTKADLMQAVEDAERKAAKAAKQ